VNDRKVDFQRARVACEGPPGAPVYNNGVEHPKGT
jgi:hypothetical protein